MIAETTWSKCRTPPGQDDEKIQNQIQDDGIFSKKYTEMKTTWSEIKSGRNQIYDGWNLIQDGECQIQDGRFQFQDGGNQIQNGGQKSKMTEITPKMTGEIFENETLWAKIQDGGRITSYSHHGSVP